MPVTKRQSSARNTSRDSEPSLRHYTSDRDDEQRVLDAFRVVFGRERSLKHWQWKFRHNPYHPPLVSMATAPGGEVVAHYTVMPVDLNVMGRAVRGCQSLDTLVHPEFRRRGLFERTAEDCYEQCREASLDVVYGFPGPQSYPGFMRKLHWRRVATLDEYFARLSRYDEMKRLFRVGLVARVADGVLRLFAGLVRRVRRVGVRLRLPEKLRYEEHTRVPEGYEAFWERLKDFEVFSVWKDRRYLAWRYDAHPDCEFTYHVLRARDGSLAALAVSAVLENRRYLFEWLVLDKGRVASDFLLATLRVRFGDDWRVRRIVFEGADSGFFREAFRSFERRYRPHRVFGLVTLAEKDELAGIELPFNWTVTLGDSDFA